MDVLNYGAEIKCEKGLLERKNMAYVAIFANVTLTFNKAFNLTTNSQDFINKFSEFFLQNEASFTKTTEAILYFFE